MTFPHYSEKKFTSLPLKQQHKKAAELLRLLYEKAEPETSPHVAHYRKLESYLSLSPIPFTFETLSDRYHYHLKHAFVSIQERNFLASVSRVDRLSNIPYLPIAIYLDHLRSAHNIGSIIRTIEAFRLGSLHFSKQTPYIDNKKVKDTAMGTETLIPTYKDTSLQNLPKPFIALETVKEATSFSSFVFPKTFTLFIGNEEYGLSSNILHKADQIIQIPLVGSKNSLNVAVAFAIIAAEIRKQHSNCISKEKLLQ